MREPGEHAAPFPPPGQAASLCWCEQGLKTGVLSQAHPSPLEDVGVKMFALPFLLILEGRAGGTAGTFMGLRPVAASNPSPANSDQPY